MLVLREKTNHISIWIFIINVMKGVSLSTHLKVVFYMKCWIPPRSCSFQLTQCWSTPTRRTNVYHDWFRDSGNKKTFLTQTLHRKMLKLLCKIKKIFCLRRDTNLTSLGKLLQSYFVTITRMLTNISLMKFQVRYLALFLLFSVIEGFEWFWMGSLQKNIQLMLEFLNAPFLVLHFSYYTLMTFLMMLSVILLSILSILSVISRAISRKN